MSRFATATFTTGLCAGNGGYLDHDLTIPSNTLDIGKIKVTPSDASGDNVVQIYGSSSRPLADLLYTTAKWQQALYVDPRDHVGDEYGQGWVCPYFDKNESLKLHFRFYNYHTSAKTFSVEVDYEYISTDDLGIVGAPEDLTVKAAANGLTILTGVIAKKNTATITEAEFRAIRLGVGDLIVNQDLRLVSEGGSFVPDGIDKLRVTGLVAGPNGCNYTFVSGDHGRWYYAWRLKNSVGWSRWSDGNAYSQNTPHWVRTQTYEDTGPPSDWEVWIEEGVGTGTIVVHATRPKVNGNNLLWWIVQIKDGDSGAWITLDNGASPSEVKYNGSATAHTLDSTDGSKLTKAESGWGSAVRGDLILLDVRGVVPLDFNVNYCLWGTVDRIEGNSLYVSGIWNSVQSHTNLTLKIVKPPWEWAGGGYLGLESNQGMWGSGPENEGLGKGWILGDESTEFSTDAIQIPTTVKNPEARVWFQNLYSRSDDGRRSSGMQGGTALIKPPTNWYNFNDRRYWIPVYPGSAWGTLSFNGVTGKATMSCASNNTYHAGISGVRARFRLHPDSTGRMEVYAKFTNVTLPVGTRAHSGNAGDVFGIGIHVSNECSVTGNCVGCMLMTAGTDAGQVCLNAPFYWMGRTPNPYGGQYEPWYHAPSPNFARPTPGAIVELKWSFGVDPSSYWKYVRQTYAVSARVGGSGPYTSKTITWAQEGVTFAMGHMELFVGLAGNCKLAGGTATLEQVSIINGLCEFY